MTEIQQPTIFITLQGGVVQSITGDDVNVSIYIRDLDDIEDGADDPMPTDYHPTRVYF